MSLHGIPRHLLLAAARLPENSGAARTLLERAGAPCPAPTAPQAGVVAQDAFAAPDGALRVLLPLPAKALHPNARVHWRVKHKATKEARRKAFFAGWEALVTMGKPCAVAPPMWEAATVKIVWYAKTRRWPDPDNALAATKAYMDGLAAPTHNGIGAGIIANDSGFSFLPVKVETDKENPRVEIYVWES